MRPRTQSHRSQQSFVRALAPRLILALVLLALSTSLLWKRVFVVIESGEAGVLWNRFAGTRIDKVYEERLHVISPLDRMYKYEMRKQIAPHTLDILSVEGLTLTLHLAIRYQPQPAMLGMLHDRIGPDYLTRVVIPQTESVLRKELSEATAEAIHTNEDDLLTTAILRTMEEVARNFVEIEDVIIRRIDLPLTVQEAIEEKLRERELLQSYAFRGEIALQEAERKRIEATGIRDYYQTIDQTMNERLLAHQTIEVTKAIAASDAEKTVVVGATNGLSLPIFLPEMDVAAASSATATPPHRIGLPQQGGAEPKSTGTALP